MRLSKYKTYGLILSSFILGFIAQRISLSDASSNPGFFNNYLGFTILIPLFLGLFILFLHFSRLKSKFLITLFSIILFEGVMILNFTLYPLFGGPTSEMYAIMYYLGFMPALVIGLVYGLYIAYNLDMGSKK